MQIEVPTDVIVLIARRLDLQGLVRLSAVNVMFRKGCYDPIAVRGAIEHSRGGKITRGELQHFLKISHVAAAALSYGYYPRCRYRPRSYYLYDASVVAAAMHHFGENERVISWKPKPNPQPSPQPNPRNPTSQHRRQSDSSRRKRPLAAAPDLSPITAFFPQQDTQKLGVPFGVTHGDPTAT